MLDGLENIRYCSGAHNQRLAKAGAIRLKLNQTIVDKMPMTARRKWLTPILRFNDIERQNWKASSTGGSKRRMVIKPQVAFKPNYREFLRHLT